MGDKDETWRQKIRFQQSSLLLFGALCRDGLQKEFDRCKARSCEKCRPSIFTWSDHNDEVSQRSERARIRGDKTTMPFAGPLDIETESTTGTFEAMTASKNNPQEADLDGKPQDRHLVAEICDLRQRHSLSKFGLEQFASSDDDIFFYTGFQSYSALIAFWIFVKPCSESLLSWNRARAKVNGNFADTAFPYLQGQTKEKQRKREIQPIDQL